MLLLRVLPAGVKLTVLGGNRPWIAGGAELERTVDLLSYINNALYVALATVAFVQWRRLKSESAAWLALTFALLAGIGITSLFLGGDPGDEAPLWVTKLLIVAVVLFPYCLYRFMATFVHRKEWRRRLALFGTLAVVLFTLLVPELPGPGEPRSAVVNIYLLALMVQWSSLLILVAYHFWRAGRGQPSVARRRMRLLSLASLGMTLALVVAITTSNSTDPGMQMVIQLFATASVLAFFLGFAPPVSVRVVWRMSEQDALRAGIRDLLQAGTTSDVSEQLLPHVARIVAARSVQLLSPQGDLVGSYTQGDEEADDPDDRARPATEELRLEFDYGSLLVSASPYTPYFGRDEVELMETLGALAGLAIERTDLFAKERDARLAMERANAGFAEANDELHQSRRSLAEAQAVAQIGSFEWDVASDRVTWSDQMFRNFGQKPGSIQVDFTSYLSLVDPEDRDFVSSVVTRSLEDLKPYEFDHRIQTPDGQTRVLHARGRVDVDAEGRPLRVHGTAQDVTELRLAEKNLNEALEREREARRSLEDLNDEMESFVYTVSHDLNSPLISLLGFLEFLEKDFGEGIPEKGRFYMERMVSSARYMQALIRDLLDLSRIGRVQTHPEVVELSPVLDEIALEIRTSAPSFVLEADDLPTVYMNRVRARQLFANLLNNSVKYGGAGTRVSVGAVMVEDGLYEVSVKDDGPGIPAEDRSRVFGVFERLQGATGAEEGTGIGLSICKRIVETVGGTIWIVDSATGLDVRFTLPAPDEATEHSDQARLAADG
jgi:PAS domain S-box-containing protein